MKNFKAPHVLSVSNLKAISAMVNRVFNAELGIENFVKFGSLERDEYGMKVCDGWACDKEDFQWSYNFIGVDVKTNRSFYKVCERLACVLDTYYGFEWDYTIVEVFEYDDHVGTLLIFEPVENVNAREAYIKEKADERRQEREARLAEFNARRAAESHGLDNSTTLGDIEALARLKAQLDASH